MEKLEKIKAYNEGLIKPEKINIKKNSNKNQKLSSINRLTFNVKMTQVDIPPLKTIASNKNSDINNILHINEILIPDKFSNKKVETFNTDILNLKYTINDDISFNLYSKNNKNANNKLNEEKIFEEKHLQKSIEKNKSINSKKEEINLKGNRDKIYITKTTNKKNNTTFSIITKKTSRNIVPIIKQSSVQIDNQVHIDKSLKNWNELKQNYIEHLKNQEIFKNYEKNNLPKNNFISNNFRKFYFGRKNIQGMPYYYDISSTYMNKYQNKSEHNRHETLIDELDKLRAYLLKFKVENNTDIIKDFLIKHNMPNIQKYTNYQLMQFGRFVCQEDIYKINSLLKPYMHIKDMINDLLENSENLNEKFTMFKFNSSIKNFLNNIKSNKSQPVLLTNQKSQGIGINKQRNKKFYISELDYPLNKKEKMEKINYNNESQNDISDGITNRKHKDDSNYMNIDEEKNIFENNKRDFNIYSNKRKELLKNIGISKKHVFKHVEKKDSYCSPLFNIKTFQKHYDRNSKKIILPKLSNNIKSFYKPNKILLSPDKNYSLNFGLLYKDVMNELNNFQNDYERKFDIDVQKDAIKNIKLSHSKSCENIKNDDDITIKKKLEQKNRLFFGKKNIKVDLEEIQRKHKLTEYIALLNAKKRIKNEIINDNIINY